MPEDYPKFDLNCKIIIIGNSGVGKSCLTLKAIKNTNDFKSFATIGFDIFNFCVKINGKVINLQIWDTCGQEKYISLITSFYANSLLAIIIYAINE